MNKRKLLIFTTDRGEKKKKTISFLTVGEKEISE